MSNCIALIGRKVGMSSVYNESGHIIPVTMIQIDKNVILDVLSSSKGSYDAVVMTAFETTKEHKVNKAQRGIFKKRGLGLFRKIKEFRLPCSIPSMSSFVGRNCGVTEDMKGSFLDLQCISTGKGFQGPMKRWGFKGLRASHGVSVSHRSHGSTGHRTDPGKVFKGKKMAGRMGGGLVVQQNVFVLDALPSEGLLVLRGSVPGRNGSVVYISDAVRKRNSGSSPQSFNSFSFNSSESSNVNDGKVIASGSDSSSAEVTSDLS